MNKWKSYIILLSFLFLLSGCINHTNIKNSDVNLSEKAMDNETIPFEYFFRGFITLKESQVDAYPKDTYIIETDEDWHDFMDKYVPGIPYYLSVDYSKECLIFNVTFPAKPTYSTSSDIQSFNIVENKLEPEYVENELGDSNCIYAQNIDGIEHCFVNIVKVNREYLPKDAENIYHKDDLSNK